MASYAAVAAAPPPPHQNQQQPPSGSNTNSHKSNVNSNSNANSNSNDFSFWEDSCIGSSLSAICQLNRLTLLKLLHQHPTATPTAHDSEDERLLEDRLLNVHSNSHTTTTQSTSSVSVSHTQYLYFADEALRTLMLRHVLRNVQDDNTPPSTSHATPPTAHDSEEERLLEDRLLNSTHSTQSSVTHTQYLYFADEALRTLMLRHVLRTVQDDNVATVFGDAKKKKNKKNKRKKDVEQYVGGVPYPPNLGIQGTRLLGGDAGGLFDAAANSSMDGMGTVSGVCASSSEIAIRNSSSGAEIILQAGAVQEDNGMFEDGLGDGDGVDVLLYFVRPTLPHTKLVSQRIKNMRQAQPSNGANAKSPRHTIVFVPQSTSICRRLLLDEGLLSDSTTGSASSSSHTPHIQVVDLDIDLVPLEHDVLSVELPHALRECYVEGTPSNIVSIVAKSLLKIQDCHGVIPRVQGLGVL
eukprot:CAMPEP_0194444726 /NCGR_PEP_ID=MMETSP0176-20130528/127448_1 /TAXON_ID=216777 /ORGANISM="Proboscia alata, Strain PI-D3" /LENGTH=465 /DNA_ID=CAMNT_0039271171 /DNA_START=17 /DNA_END=1411 /DNA_ORIENTATION=+